ncbi:MAG: InlB B-repeat-containing protein [Anaerovoracaceae bacterium]|jgi:uncharacterized repeat protein (TIGR02543 family)
MLLTCFAWMQPQSVRAAENTNTGYRLATYSGTADPEYDQHVTLTLTFDQNVNIADESALNNSIYGSSPSCNIMIAGRSIASDEYYRPSTYFCSGKTLTIDIGNCQKSPTDTSKVFTAIYAGMFRASGTLKGLSFTGAAGDATVSVEPTFIPNGVTFDHQTGQDTSRITTEVTHPANVRSMYHFVVYKVRDEGKNAVVPITAGKGFGDAYTVSSHAHMFYKMDTAALAKNIAEALNNAFPEGSGYSASAEGSKFTVTSADSSDKLRVYMYNDDYLQSDDVCTLQIPTDTSITLASTKPLRVDFPNGELGYYSYPLKVTGDPDGIAAWLANAELTIDGTKLTFSAKAPASPEKYSSTYTQGGKTYTDYYWCVVQDGDSFCLNVSGAPFKTDTSEHTLTITNSLFTSGTGVSSTISVPCTVTFTPNGGKKLSLQVRQLAAGAALGKLPTVQRSKYALKGWYTARKGGSKVSSRTAIQNDRTLYAQWTKVRVSKGKVTSLKAGRKKLTARAKKASGVSGYQFRCAKRKSMKAAKVKTTKSSRVTFAKLKKKTRYYVQVRAFKKDSTEKTIYGKWSSRVSKRTR